MRGKLWFALGAAAGFVLGARAGREKYETIVYNARKVWDHPTVQEAAGVVQAQANRLYHEGKETVTEKLGSSRLGEKLSTSGTTSSASSTPSTMPDDGALASSPAGRTGGAVSSPTGAAGTATY